MVYLAEYPALELLEVRVHLDLPFSLIPDDHIFMHVAIPDDVATVTPDPVNSDTVSTRAVGDLWLASGQTCLAKVKSVLAPRSFNYLLNPQHPDASRVTIVDRTPFSFDQRL